MISSTLINGRARIVQRELTRKSKVGTPALNDAEGAPNLALAALNEKRYEGAIAEARKASHFSRGNG
jgi:hypothetical protein